jgi:hypothetical protein
MHIVPILWLLTWPVLIAVCFYGVWWAVKKFESKLDKKEDQN